MNPILLLQITGVCMMLLIVASFYFKMRVLANMPKDLVLLLDTSLIRYLTQPIFLRKVKRIMPELPIKIEADIKKANYYLYVFYILVVSVTFFIAYLVKTGLLFKVH